MIYSVFIPNFKYSPSGWSNQRTGKIIVNRECIHEGDIAGRSFDIDLNIGDTITYEKYFKGRLDISKSIYIKEHYNSPKIKFNHGK